MKKGLVSVVITTKNEEAVIERLLRSLKAQTYKNNEIIVVDNNSSDKTKKIAEKFTSRVFNLGPERSVQRNFGAKVSKGEFVLFLDADMELKSDVLEQCVQAVKVSSKIGGVIIPEESVASNYWEKVKAFERSFYNLEGDETTDAARFFRKQAFLKVKGYDESITGPEDWDMPESVKSAGYKFARINSLIYHYERIHSVLTVAKKKYYYALKAHRYLAKQKISLMSGKTIYFLRPVFYRNWKRLIRNPMLSLSMILMLSLENFYGGIGFLVGKFKKL